ncbi:hypothetical protein EIP86_009900 [Pleurotus ostreatoroseus]|nr:hypothetical protein EIP86_009900 [Pleurotus ostreatoroseus]
MSSLNTQKSLGLPPIPRTQALNSLTFRPPPLDGSLSVPELYDWHLDNSPDHPLFVYSNSDGAAKTIVWKEAAHAVHRTGRLVLDAIRPETEKACGRVVIAILANNDSIMYFTLVAAIIRAGHVVFPISPRNSPAAIAYLLSKMGAMYIFVGSEDALQDLAAAAFRNLSDSKNRVPIQAQFPTFADAYEAGIDDPFEPLPPLQFEWNDPLVILHSSGSTAFPKPLVYTHERYVLACLAPWFGERDLTGKRLACHSMPMYHGMGVMQVGWTAFSGLVLTVFESRIPAVVPSPESVMKGAMDTSSNFIFCVPSFVEAWAKKPSCVQWLQKTEGIIFGGGPLAKEVGDYLTEQGVTIFVMYGNTECGINNIILPKEVDKDWEYFAFPANVKPHFKLYGDGSAELVLMMILVASPSKPFTYTAKNTPRRQAIINEYEKEIETLYTSAERTIQYHTPLPSTQDFEHILPYVRKVVHGVLGQTIGDTDDVFQHGCDSLQATWIRNTLLQAMRGVVDARALSSNFVHQHPSIHSLATFASATLNSGYSPVPRDQLVEGMERMVAKYMTDIPTPKPSDSVAFDSEAQTADTVVVTGTTGGLGTALLVELVSSPGIGCIYALNRGTSNTMMDRQRSSLEKQIRANTTHYILNAWPLNFNHVLPSFEPNIRSVRFFIDLALTSPRRTLPRVVFCSSVGVLRNLDCSISAREEPITPEVAAGSGYTESKWVIEKLLQEVATRTPLRPVSIRIGQLCGSKSGYWNEAEWFPSLVKSSVFLKSFPEMDKSISLLFAEDAARAICELRNSNSPILHLTHPESLSWHIISDTANKELSLQTVPYNVWFGLLQKSADRTSMMNPTRLLHSNPALKLVEFFADAEVKADSTQAMGFPEVDGTAAQTACAWLRQLPLPSQDVIARWLRQCYST